MSTLCACGCGEYPRISDRTDPKRGAVKGMPLRFVNGHNGVKHGAERGRHSDGEQATPEYSAYTAARARCVNPKNPRYPTYGGRGIKFLFTSFEQFFAEVGTRPTAEHSIDRKNNDGNYEPGNVRWATLEEQLANKQRNNQFTRGRRGTRTAE